MRILYLDDNYKDMVFNIIKKEKMFHYEEKTDSNFLTVNMYMVLDDNNNFIGFFGLSSMDFALCVCYLYVFEEYRNQGYAKEILKRIKNKNCSDYQYIYLLVDKNNKEALALYKNYNFLAKDRRSFISGKNYLKAIENNELYTVDGNYEVILYYYDCM